MQRAKEAGLTFITHAGNASDWPHRAPGIHGFMSSEPGIVGTLLADPDFSASVIMDGHHFHPALLAPLVQLRGEEQVLLTSDASPVAGCSPGQYICDGLAITVDHAGFALSGLGGGWLAGSTIRLIDALRRAVQLAHLPLHQAICMASFAPAKLLGLQVQKGTLQPGADADIVILDADLSLRTVLAGGKQVDPAP
jgi:N-acetylglucosamine-6-phosphate deacetylase